MLIFFSYNMALIRVMRISESRFVWSLHIKAAQKFSNLAGDNLNHIWKYLSTSCMDNHGKAKCLGNNRSSELFGSS